MAWPTIGAIDVGEDGPEILILCQFIDYFCQAAGGHFEEVRQTFGQTGVDQELCQEGGADLQHGEEPNSPPNFLKTEHTRHTDESWTDTHLHASAIIIVCFCTID